MKHLTMLFSALLRYLIFHFIENASAEICNRQDYNSAPLKTESIRIAALGRVAALGDLYDARREKFVQISLYGKKLSDDIVESTDNAYSDITYVRTESLSEKMDKLGVSGSLKVSFLLGMVKASGSGKYLNEEKSKAKSAKTSLVYSIRTVSESLKIFYKASLDSMDKILRESIDATHIVVGLEWGANVVLSIEEASTDSSNMTEIQGELNIAINKFSLAISGSAAVNTTNFDLEKSKSFKLRLNGDIVPSTVPQTIKESIDVIRNITQLVKSNNDGKGKIMNFILISLDTVRKYCDPKINKSSAVRDIEQDMVDQLIKIFQEIQDSKLQINDIYSDMTNWAFMIPKNEFEDVSDMKNKFDSFANALKMNFSNQVVKFRSYANVIAELKESINEYSNSNWTLAKIIKRINDFAPTMRKISLLMLFERFKASFVDRRRDKYEILVENYKQEIRIISIDLNIDISSVYVHNIVKLLEIEQGKESGHVKYYIEDAADLNVPIVKIYLEGKVKNSFSIDEHEYVVLICDNRNVIITNGSSYNEITEYKLTAKGGWLSIAIVNDYFYVIDSRNGTIKNIGISSILTKPEDAQWDFVGSFPEGDSNVLALSAANESAFYFVTKSPDILFKYDTLLKTVTECTRNLKVSEVTSLIVVNETLYIHSAENFYSFDGTDLKDLPKSNKTNPGLFEYSGNICFVGGDIVTDDCSKLCYPVKCYDPSTEKWETVSHSNQGRMNPAVTKTLAGTLIFGGYKDHKNGTSSVVQSVEVFNPNTQIFSYVPKPSTSIGVRCIAATIYN